MQIKNLGKIRKEKGYTQEALARKADVSFHTIVKIEQGTVKNPRVETLMKLAKTLGVKIDDLV